MRQDLEVATMLEQAYRKIIIPGFESILKQRKAFRYWQELEESQWWSLDELEAQQLVRLQALVQHCFEKSVYYSSLWKSKGLSVRDLQTLQDFQAWPITSRDVMRDQVEQIRSRDKSLRVVTKSTGGSSGSPLKFVIDHEANDRRMGAAYRGYAWAGAAPGTRQTHLWGVTLGKSSHWRRWKEHLYSRYLYRRDVLNCFELSDASVPQFLQRMHRFRPDVLVAYTNPLCSFARAIEERGLSPYFPKAIIVGAEKLHGFQRELIERVFRAPVFETYGSREFTLIGAECERHTGLHLTHDNLLVEVVDDEGSPTPAGEEGNIVITDLFNIAMPFVRYAIGDRAIAGFETCECGRGLPLLRKVVGRQLDMLVTADGHQLAGEYFPHLLKDYESVRQFQVVQSRCDQIELKLVVNSGWGPELREALRREVQYSIGKSTNIVIHEVDSIPLTRAGKLRVVIRESSVLLAERHDPSTPPSLGPRHCTRP